MKSPFAAASQWFSPMCFAVSISMAWLGSNGAELTIRDWLGAIYWAACGALVAFGTAYALLNLRSARQHLRVARARIQHHRQRGMVSGPPVRFRRGEFHN